MKHFAYVGVHVSVCASVTELRQHLVFKQFFFPLIFSLFQRTYEPQCAWLVKWGLSRLCQLEAVQNFKHFCTLTCFREYYPGGLFVLSLSPSLSLSLSLSLSQRGMFLWSCFVCVWERAGWLPCQRNNGDNSDFMPCLYVNYLLQAWNVCECQGIFVHKHASRST